MAINDAFADGVSGIADGNDFIIDGSGTGTGAAEIQEVFGTGACVVYKEVDVDGDSTFEVTAQIEAPGGEFHSQLNGLLVSQSQNTRIRINNTSGGTADFGVAGFEVTN